MEVNLLPFTVKRKNVQVITKRENSSLLPKRNFPKHSLKHTVLCVWVLNEFVPVMLLERTILLGQLKNWNCKFWFFHYYKSKDREIDQNDRETLELQVKVNNQPSDASQSKDLDILDEVGTLTIKLKQLVPNILADSESIESFPLISPFVACPGLVSLQVVYKTNTILAPAVYEDFLRLLEEDGFFLIRTLINHR
eukprot:TRINITY_DN4027_c0_g2_i2.p1 TRINITY_DN4027_c0_g2~~TRINITY_DN4027_c0_g2_i2.p1  ORF type:complete len:195 (+),score=33.92 TRINITY_DN4027_c0_g2_i2:121-705(+)